MTEEAFVADPLTEEQLLAIKTRLAALQEWISRAAAADWSTTLLIQTVANARALRSECDRFIRVVEHIPTETMVRYAVQPAAESMELGTPPRIVDLNDFRAPTDLRGLEP